MIQKDKELLLKDLCARLPYGVHLFTNSKHHIRLLTISRDLDYDEQYWINGLYDIDEVKLYLRPISSMTEEEKEELKQISNDYLDEWENTKTPLERWKLDAKVSYKRAVFYNSHHFDWNDLIPKGLAIEVTEENNPYKE